LLLKKMKMTKIYKFLAFSLVILLGKNLSVSAQVYNFNYTGAVQTFTVPPGILNITVLAQGASGGMNSDPVGHVDSPGHGGCSQATFAVTPGQVINVYVGGHGSKGATSVGGAGGFNGGGTGGAIVGSYGGGGGGGESDIRFGTTPMLIGAGGGGAGAECGGNHDKGGDGGTLTGQAGAATCTPPPTTTGGVAVQDSLVVLVVLAHHVSAAQVQ
jgi:Glycine rich protein